MAGTVHSKVKVHPLILSHPNSYDRSFTNLLWLILILKQNREKQIFQEYGLHWNCETHETALAKHITDSLNLLWWFCRFHDLRCLPHLHLPQEGDTEGLQRPEERTLWLLFCPVVGLRPSAPDQRCPLHPPAQEAVSKTGMKTLISDSLSLASITSKLTASNSD